MAASDSWFSMADPPGFTSGGFRLHMAYKIRIRVVVPRDLVTIVSELNLYSIFLPSVV